MDKNFNWRKYYYILAIATFILCVFNYKFSIGWLLGNLCYFLNDKIVSLKFRNLKDTSIVGNIIFYMLVQMIIVGSLSYISWIIGKLTTFIIYVVGVICPNIYYTINSVFIKKQ